MDQFKDMESSLQAITVLFEFEFDAVLYQSGAI